MLFTTVLFPAQRQPYPQTVQGIQKIKGVLDDIYQGIGSRIRIGCATQGDDPHHNRGHVHRYPEIPLLGIRHRKQELADNVADRRDCIHKHDCPEERLGTAPVESAQNKIQGTGGYTCHTPVPAGHDYFDKDLFGKYMGSYPQVLGITWQEFIGMGRTNPEDDNEKFSMSTFALNTCQEANGVSKLHGWVSQKMFAPIWKGYWPEENHVGYVTNGVHFPTWCATEMRRIYSKYFDYKYFTDQSNEEYWHSIYNCPDSELWATRMALKEKLDGKLMAMVP